jgi:hypothetical protein
MFRLFLREYTLLAPGGNPMSRRLSMHIFFESSVTGAKCE